MAQIELNRHNYEVLASAPPIAKDTRLVVETVHDSQAESTAEIQAHRLNIEALAQSPQIAKSTRLVTEVIHDSQVESTAEIQVHRSNIQVLGNQPVAVKTTRLVNEVVFDSQTESNAQIEISRLNWEVIGRRFIAMSPCDMPALWEFFAHNWADEIKLTTRYRTAVSRGAESLAEDRTQLFERPRRTIEVRYTELGLDDKANLQRLIQSMRSMTTEDWVVPLYCDMGLVTQDAASGQPVVRGDFRRRRFFTGGRVMLVPLVGPGGDTQKIDGTNQVFVSYISYKNDENEFVLADNLDFSVLANGAVLMPLMCVHPHMQHRFRRYNGRVWDVTFEFEEKGGPTCIPATQDDVPPDFDVYRNWPILRARHNFSRAMDITIFQEGEQPELGRGKITVARGEAARVKHRFRLVEDSDRDVMWDYVRFFDSRKGRLLPYWLVDQEAVFTVANIQTNFIDVVKVGDFTEFQKQMDYFGFELLDGTCYVREIITIQDIGTAWRLTVADTLPTIPFQNVALAGRARPTRMLEDAFTEVWSHIKGGEFTLDTISLLEEKNVDLSA